MNTFRIPTVLCMGVAMFMAMLCGSAHAQTYGPGQFSMDGVPVSCGAMPTVVTSGIPDMAMTDGRVILLNPSVMGGLPTVLKLFVFAHECGHSMVGPDEVAADCWAIRTGRNQGWFPPQAFQLLMMFFQGNPGSLRHPPGPDRVRNMMICYQN